MRIKVFVSCGLYLQIFKPNSSAFVHVFEHTNATLVEVLTLDTSVSDYVQIRQSTAHVSHYRLEVFLSHRLHIGVNYSVTLDYGAVVGVECDGRREVFGGMANLSEWTFTTNAQGMYQQSQLSIEAIGKTHSTLRTGPSRSLFVAAQAEALLMLTGHSCTASTCQTSCARFCSLLALPLSVLVVLRSEATFFLHARQTLGCVKPALVQLWSMHPSLPLLSDLL